MKERIVICMLFTLPLIIFNFSSGLAEETSEEQFKWEEELLLLSEESFTTATKTKRKVSDAPGIVTVITADEIKNMGAHTLFDALQTVPGFLIFRGLHDQQVVGVRGIIVKKVNKIKVMINGHNIAEPLTGSAFHFGFSEMPVEFIERIEIIRGPGSALYGENAFLAVINIITKKAEDIDGLIFQAGAGSFDTQDYNILFGRQLERLKISAYADYLESGGKHLEIERDITGLSGHTNDWIDRYYFDLNLAYRDLDFEYLITGKKSAPNLTPTFALTDETYFDVTRMFADLKYNHRVNPRLSFKPRLYFDLFDWVFNNEAYPEGFTFKGTVYPDGIVERRSTQSITWGGEMDLHYSPFEGNELLAGYQYQYFYYRDTTLEANYDPVTKQPLPGGFQDISDRLNFIDPDFHQHLWAIYLQDEWALTDNLFLTLGGRYDHYSNFSSFKSKFSPRLSLVWALLEHLHLKFLYGEAFKVPDTLEQNGKNNIVALGDPYIKPEKIKTHEVGLRYDPTKYFQGEINLFHNKITDLINFGPRPSKLDPQPYINQSKIEAQGVEVSVKSEHSRDTYALANYSFVDSKDEEGANVPDISQHIFNIILNTYLCKYLNGNIDLLYRSSKARAADDPRDEIPAYYVVNSTLLAHNFYPNLEISASVYNLFDKEYDNPTPVKFHYNLPDVGRNYFVYLRYRF